MSGSEDETLKVWDLTKPKGQQCVATLGLDITWREQAQRAAELLRQDLEKMGLNEPDGELLSPTE
ncbi:MAG: hypothetical protein PUP46_07955 [Endozoicomonas sp. (ex Botrylloides leachii)]|nr:hypothetical protein [Endozoicomonas sp. (ex Botrylloides leachii)]